MTIWWHQNNDTIIRNHVDNMLTPGDNLTFGGNRVALCHLGTARLHGHRSWEPLSTCFGIIRWILIFLILIFKEFTILVHSTQSCWCWSSCSSRSLDFWPMSTRCLDALVILWHDDMSLEFLPGAFNHLSFKVRRPCWTFLQKHLSVTWNVLSPWHLLPVKGNDRSRLFFNLPLIFAFEWIFKKIF